ncbi:MAG: hypothetical protein BroJett003_05240 [Planctomycetota bacterium]|nr:MAG: hypothetical protein BroJett003_05240 [Planctomycetota bacterium]
MKLAQRQKFSGKARATFERARQDQRWMEACIDEYFDPELPFTHGERVVPVRYGTPILAEVSGLEGSGGYPSLESALDARDETEVAAVSTPSGATASAVRATFMTDSPVAAGVKYGVDLLPRKVEAPVFSWVRFALGCGLGAAAAVGAWLLAGWAT